ncbi:RusA family crossover junction endodeoxyribonuclease [Helcococcus ovis]|uniref:RusA family crossover junction endodeoxyribonuclease n=1 Tax=Helcococcus ovis TaxID=72026 RepID=UPI0010705996|nr:RusA family crossover junction endodeoxyribonuclease [Helcococcus ovis]TFF68344.1 RusA family crossover junction endodeoxyribonuclease [Helcococcus ovis]WNZ00903.1 RusA family crossover junction endodeoxyribonuclease [Helcococcus ovis]
MVIEFFIPLEKIPTATGQQKKITWSHKANKPIIYDALLLREAKEIFKANLYKHTPEEPLSGAIRLTTKWLYGTKDKNKIGIYKYTKPDTDNIIKAFKDQMTKLRFWKDDSQIASEITEKFWNDIVGIYVKIEELS